MLNDSNDIYKKQTNFLYTLYDSVNGNTSASIDINWISDRLNLSEDISNRIQNLLANNKYIKLLPKSGKISITYKGVKFVDDKKYFTFDFKTRQQEAFNANKNTLKTSNKHINDKSESAGFGHGNFPLWEANGSAKVEKRTNEIPFVKTTAISDATVARLDDSLDYYPFAESIADFINHTETEAPLTIAVTGEWGSGKTTVMEWVDYQLKHENNKAFTVWFSPWKHGNSEAVWASFFRAIIDKSIVDDPLIKIKLGQKRFFNELPSMLFFWRWIPLVILIFIPVLLLALYNEQISIYIRWLLIGSYTSIPLLFYLKKFYKSYFQSPVLKLWSSSKGPDYDEKLGFQAAFEKDLELLFEIISKNHNKIIVFIDDLDRSPPPVPVQVIEAMNLIVSFKKCIFIMGLDLGMVAASIEAKYFPVMERFNQTNSNSIQFTGMNFIEKIIQLSIALPKPTQDHIDQHIRDLLSLEPDLPANHVPKTPIDSTEKRKIEPLVDQRNKNFKDCPEFNNSVKKISRYLPRNPRKVKRYINNFRFLVIVATKRGLFTKPEEDLYHLGLITLAALEHSNLYTILLKDDAKNTLAELREKIDHGYIHEELSSVNNLNIGATDSTRYISFIESLENIPNYTPYTSLISVIDTKAI